MVTPQEGSPSSSVSGPGYLPTAPQSGGGLSILGAQAEAGGKNGTSWTGQWATEVGLRIDMAAKSIPQAASLLLPTDPPAQCIPGVRLSYIFLCLERFPHPQHTPNNSW